jgi:hypothetical protein
MLRQVALLSLVVVASCKSGNGTGPCPTWTKCISRESAWCTARTQGANVLDAEVLDAGLACQFDWNGKSITRTYDAGAESVCPTPAEMNYSVGTEHIWGNDPVTQTDDQCCYVVGGGCA